MMGFLNGMKERIKRLVNRWINFTSQSNAEISITEYVNFETRIQVYRIWYGGDSEELAQLYRQLGSVQNAYRFWAAVSTAGLEIRKIHTGLPAIMVNTLTSIIMTDLNSIEVEGKAKGDWEAIYRENNFKRTLEQSIKDALSLGDGAYKISMDEEVSQYPIIEWYPADKIDVVTVRGRVKEVIFRSAYSSGRKEYVLIEKYGYGYIRYELYQRGREESLPLNTLDALKDLEDVEFDEDMCMAFPLVIFDSPRRKGRGKSIFSEKIDNFDAVDEAWSQWMQALRDGRPTKYILETLIPRNRETGELLPPNPFDNAYIGINDSMGENELSSIEVKQPAIPHESYNATYITALDLCLQGIISPSTIGIDVKKLDNAESQREKEKTTLYTRGKIIDALQDCIPEVVSTALKVYERMKGNSGSLADVECSINFGEYANPSFESKIETVGNAKMKKIMSNEAVVEELYGDTKPNDWKREEAEKLNAMDGLEKEEPPAVNMEGLKIEDGGQEVADGRI